MEIKLLGNCTVLITTKKVKIILDPYFSNKGNLLYRRGKVASEEYKDIEFLDGILLSHEHFDHVDYEFIEKFKDKCPLYSPETSKKTIFPHRNLVCKWDEFDIGDINITVVQADHICSAVGYVIKTEDKTIYFSGDTYYGDFMKVISENISIDIAILAITNYFPAMNISKRDILKVFEVLKFKWLIPMHKDFVQRISFKDCTVTRSELDSLLDGFNEKPNLIYLENGESFKI